MTAVVSVFSGAGGLDLGVLNALGPSARLVSWCEIDTHAQAVLRHRWPNAREIHDICTHPDIVDVDWLIGGPPCQDLSPAGARAGVHGDTRSGLIHAWAELVRRLRPRHVLVEEVPEALDPDPSGAENWASVCIGTLVDMGYGVAWGVCDPRALGVPQRRPRLFVLAALPAAGVDPRAVARRAYDSLADAACGRGAAATASTAWTDGDARAGDGAIASRSAAVALNCKYRLDNEVEDFVVAAPRFAAALMTLDETVMVAPTVAATLIGPGSSGGARTGVEETIVAVRTHRATGTTDADIWRPDTVAPTLNLNDDTGDVRATTLVIGNDTSDGWANTAFEDNVSPALGVKPSERGVHVLSHRTVRRLTMVERERLQGWPDDWTRWGRRPDGTVYEVSRTARHRMTGNGVCAPVAEAIVAGWVARTLADQPKSN